MFCLFQYLAPAGLFVARQPSQFFSDGGPSRFPIPSRDAGCEDIHAGRRPSAGSDHTKPACLGRFSSFRSFCVFVPFVAIPGKDPAAAFCKRLREQVGNVFLNSTTSPAPTEFSSGDQPPQRRSPGRGRRPGPALTGEWRKPYHCVWKRTAPSNFFPSAGLCQWQGFFGHPS